MIIRNVAQCLECYEVIESTHRHDFKSCSCGNLSVDGGKDYLKRGFVNANWIELSEDTDWIPEEHPVPRPEPIDDFISKLGLNKLSDYQKKILSEAAKSITVYRKRNRREDVTHEPECLWEMSEGSPCDCKIIRAAYQRGREDAEREFEARIDKWWDGEQA